MIVIFASGMRAVLEETAETFEQPITESLSPIVKLIPETSNPSVVV